MGGREAADQPLVSFQLMEPQFSILNFEPIYDLPPNQTGFLPHISVLAAHQRQRVLVYH